MIKLLSFPLLLTLTTCYLQTATWDGGANADWNTPSSWEGRTVPTNLETANFTTPATISATGADITVRKIVVPADSTTTSLILGQAGGSLTLFPSNVPSIVAENPNTTITVPSELLTPGFTGLLIEETSTITLDKLTTGNSFLGIGNQTSNGTLPAGTAIIREFGSDGNEEDARIGLFQNPTVLIQPNTPGLSDTYNALIFGVGSLNYSPDAANTSLSLGGVLTYSGNTTLSGGTLTLSNFPLSPQILLTDDATAQLTINSANNNPSYNGTITSIAGIGGATFELTSAAEDSFTLGLNTFQYTGPFNITGNANVSLTAGTADNINTVSASQVTLSGTNPRLNTFANTVFSGNVTVNSGQFKLNEDSGTLSIEGNYIQGTEGTLYYSVGPDPVTSDLSATTLNVTGDATLNGTITISSAFGESGITAGSKTILTSRSTTGAFSELTATQFADNAFAVSYSENNVILHINQTILPTRVVPTSSPNQVTEVNELLNDNFDLLTQGESASWYDQLNALPTSSYQEAVDAISSKVENGDLDIRYRLINNNAQVADILDRQYKDTVREMRNNSPYETPCFAEQNTGFFIQPFGNIWHQMKTTKRRSFKSGCYGTALGWDQVIANNFIYEAGVAYSHSNLSVKKAPSHNVRYSSIYVSPAFFGWFNSRGYANLMATGTVSFFKYSRVISYPGVRRVPTAKYNSYEVLVRADGGYRIPIFQSSWFQPEATVNFETIFTDAYKETGAGTMGFQQKKTTNYLLNPRIRFRIIWETLTDNFCFAPSFYTGWRSFISLNDPETSVRFENVPSLAYVNISGYKEMINQIVIGTEFYMKRLEKFDLKADAEVDLLNQIQNYKFDVKFEWFF
ncbi:MAG: hypothetical protein S4CHLAM7_00130 [Chlamydiae bacterium]|nr:hypothetical protein [Chlamydiota bacterium]